MKIGTKNLLCICAVFSMAMLCIAATASASCGSDPEPYLSVKMEGDKLVLSGTVLTEDGYDESKITYRYYHDADCTKPIDDLSRVKPGTYWVTATVHGMSQDFTSAPAEYVHGGAQFWNTSDDTCIKVIAIMTILSIMILMMSAARKAKSSA